MKGTITTINHRTGFHAVLTEEGDITVFELVDAAQPEIGDAISGALDSLGSETLKNLSQGASFDVFIQDAHCSDSRAKHLLKR